MPSKKITPYKKRATLSKFSRSSLLVAMYAIAILMARDLGGWWFLLLIQPVLIWLISSMLVLGIPKHVWRASKNNSYRMDGSLSDRRQLSENQATSQMRGSIYVAVINIALGGALLMIVAVSSFQDHSTNDFYLVLIVAAVIWIVGGSLFIRFSFLGIIEEFYQGVKKRNEEYLDTDIHRLQKESEAA